MRKHTTAMDTFRAFCLIPSPCDECHCCNEGLLRKIRPRHSSSVQLLLLDVVEPASMRDVHGIICEDSTDPRIDGPIDHRSSFRLSMALIRTHVRRALGASYRPAA